MSSTGRDEWFAFAQQQTERFWSHVSKSDGCWEWHSGTDKDGYGKFAVSLPRVNGKQKQKHVRAHRLSLMLATGQVSSGALVLHSCDNPRCVRPEHLRAGSQLENRADAVKRGRVARGERHVCAKLTDEAVRAIRELRATTKLGPRVIAQRLGVSEGAVGGVIYHNAWRHVA